MDTQLKDRVRIAAEIASNHHRGIIRKYTGEPYFEHCHRVAQRLLSWGVHDPDTLAAAYLHDYLEDENVNGQKGSVKAISHHLNLKVAKLVMSLTEPTTGNRKARQAAYNIQLEQAPDGAKLIKLADILDNISNIVEHDPGFAETYLKEKTSQWLAISKNLPAQYSGPLIAVRDEIQLKLTELEAQKQKKLEDDRKKELAKLQEFEDLAKSIAEEQIPDPVMF